MKNHTEYSILRTNIVRGLCVLLLVTGCQWMRPQSPMNYRSWNLTSAQADSLNTFFMDLERMNKENTQMREQIRSAELDLAKLRAEYENQVQLNDHLREELQSMESDLNYVERQFVSLERSIQAVETRASAVAAVAEVQLLREKVSRESPEQMDSATVDEINTRLAKSDEMMNKKNYAAAVYHTNRAMRIINLAESRKYLHGDDATRVVSVAKANIREGPGSNFKVVGKLTFGAVLLKLGADKEWYQVRAKNGKTGWIHGSLVR